MAASHATSNRYKKIAMAIIAIFDVAGMTRQQYDQTLQELQEKGLGAPDGRLYHVASINDSGCFVVDVWESEETFARFGDALMPILIGAGVTPAEPQIRPVHNSVPG